jgi:hypothetical protein
MKIMTNVSRIRSKRDPWSLRGDMTCDVMTDVKVPKFHEKRDRGDLICNPMTHYRESYNKFDVLKVDILWVDNNPQSNTYGQSTKEVRSFDPWNVIRPDVDTWENGYETAARRIMDLHSGPGLDSYEVGLLHTEVSAKLTSGMAQILVEIMEFHKTKNMILKAVDYLRRPLKDVWRIGKRMTAQERIDTVNGWWLEGRYGWRPFIHGVADVVKAHKSTVGHRLTKKAWKQSVEFEEVHFATAAKVYGVGTAWNLICEVQNVCRVGQTGDFLAGMMHNARVYGMYDLAGSGWEVVPYSFVMDWFINIGEAAKAMQAYLMLDERIGWTTFEKKATFTVNCPQLLSELPLWGGSTIIRRGQVTGNASIELAKVSVTERIPVDNFLPVIGVRNDLDWAKVIDACALLRNAWNKFKKPP